MGKDKHRIWSAAKKLKNKSYYSSSCIFICKKDVSATEKISTYLNLLNIRVTFLVL